MNLIYLHQHFVTREGYSGTRSYEFSRYLVKKGQHQVYLITGKNRKSNLNIPDHQKKIEINVDGIKLQVLNIPYAQNLTFWARIKAFLHFSWRATFDGLKKKSIHIVFATSTPITVAIPALIIAWIKRIPFVFEIRDIWPESAMATGVLTNPIIIVISRCFERVVYHFSNRIVVISHRMKQHLLQKNRLDPNKISVIHIGADLDVFGLGKRTDFRKKYELEGKFIAIFAGAHGIANGLNLLVDASIWLPDNCRILLIGEGVEKASLMSRAKQIGTDKVLFLDPVPKIQLADIMHEVDCCCMILKRLSLFETACPNKFFDYLASGKPIVVNFPGEISAMIEKYRAGIYVKENSSKYLANVLSYLSENKGVCNEMGFNAIQLAKKYNRLIMAKKFENLLKNVVNQK